MFMVMKLKSSYMFTWSIFIFLLEKDQIFQKLSSTAQSVPLVLAASVPRATSRWSHRPALCYSLAIGCGATHHPLDWGVFPKCGKRNRGEGQGWEEYRVQGSWGHFSSQRAHSVSKEMEQAPIINYFSSNTPSTCTGFWPHFALVPTLFPSPSPFLLGSGQVQSLVMSLTLPNLTGLSVP